ncbi:putative serine/arginine-rich splicing factor protein [Trifolium repens]|jgi:hypothetical protein|nr:putative serine/arginine-rich splicing factor protein [Trifolium repens]
MREKEEREALPRASGAIRLTEFDPERKDGFVNRLNKETTSFFFTNFPEEAQVIELWSLFAKHGRVGEVYVPKKRDRRGNRFGFVKFKDVKSIDALCDRLEDVWLGSFKVKVNLARFGRDRKEVTHQRKGGSIEKKGGAPTVSTGEVRTSVDNSFKTALVGTSFGPGKSDLPSVVAEIVPEMMEVLQGSYVGRLAKGVEFRALQVKLWLAGLHSVRVSTMGDDLVLLSRSSGEDVGEPACKKDWWGGLLVDVRTWSPNRSCTNRVIWVRLHGIPPHAWGETSFRKLVNNCGEFLDLDSETRNKTRF